MKELKIPGVPAKYNMFIIVIIVIVVFFLLFPDMLKNLFKGITDGIGKGLGLTPNEGDQTLSDEISWMGNYERTRKNDCWSTSLYDNNQSAASINSNTASNLWQNVKDCKGWFSNDMSKLQGQFDQVVGNQVDISFVSRKCYDEKGKDLFMYLAYTFDDQDNEFYLVNFIKWGNSLPTT